jgi:heme/copper-type cytochrome/quinol oxidase subunit 4
LFINIILIGLAMGLPYIHVTEFDGFGPWGTTSEIEANYFETSCDYTEHMVCASLVGYCFGFAFTIIATLVALPWHTWCGNNNVEYAMRLATGLLSTVATIGIALGFFASLGFMDHGSYMDGFYIAIAATAVSITCTGLAWAAYRDAKNNPKNSVAG